MRIFLDTCTLQFVFDYGAYIFDNDRTIIDKPIKEYPNGKQNLEALHDIMQVNMTGGPSFSFVLSDSSMHEISNRGESGYWRYALDVLDTWQITQSEHGEDAFSGEGKHWSKKISRTEFDYLGDSDRQLLSDALSYECEVFLTVEEKLPKNADHLNKELPLEVLRPFEFWEGYLASHFENYPSWG